MDEKSANKEQPLEQSKIKRPVGVWIFIIYFIGSSLLTLLAFSIDPGENRLLDKLSTLELLSVALVNILNFLSAIMLFKMKVVALWIFLSSFLISYLQLIPRVFNNTLDAYFEGVAVGNIIYQLAVWLLALFYLAYLKQKKIIT